MTSTLLDDDITPLACVTLIRGALASGEPYYAYLAVTLEKHQALLAHIETHPTYRLEDFGQILYWNIGHSPSEEVQAVMAARYGAVATLEQDLEAWMEARKLTDGQL